MKNERYNIFLKKVITLSDGEEFCPVCDGKGKIQSHRKEKPYVKSHTYIYNLQCHKCLGAGKLDWVEKVTGKKVMGYDC
jgi:DnaJ-class molecular chaperone